MPSGPARRLSDQVVETIRPSSSGGVRCWVTAARIGLIGPTTIAGQTRDQDHDPDARQGGQRGEATRGGDQSDHENGPAPQPAGQRLIAQRADDPADRQGRGDVAERVGSPLRREVCREHESERGDEAHRDRAQQGDRAQGAIAPQSLQPATIVATQYGSERPARRLSGGNDHAGGRAASTNMAGGDPERRHRSDQTEADPGQRRPDDLSGTVERLAARVQGIEADAGVGGQVGSRRLPGGRPWTVEEGAETDQRQGGDQREPDDRVEHREGGHRGRTQQVGGYAHPAATPAVDQRDRRAAAPARPPPTRPTRPVPLGPGCRCG